MIGRVATALVLSATGLGGVGCRATSLLVGGSGEVAADGTTAADVDGGPGSSGAAEADTGTTAVPTTTAALDSTGATGTATSGDSTQGIEPSSDSGGPCDANGEAACEALSCVWLSDVGQCVTGEAACGDLPLGDCFSTDPCLWLGTPGDGYCEAAQCETLVTERSCGDAASCAWGIVRAGGCSPGPCWELGADFCEADVLCDFAGASAAPICLDVECLVGECTELNQAQCNETPGCAYVGLIEDGNCVRVECLPCEELDLAPCEAAAGCEWNAELEVCVG